MKFGSTAILSLGILASSLVAYSVTKQNQKDDQVCLMSEFSEEGGNFVYSALVNGESAYVSCLEAQAIDEQCANPTALPADCSIQQ